MSFQPKVLDQYGASSDGKGATAAAARDIFLVGDVADRQVHFGPRFPVVQRQRDARIKQGHAGNANACIAGRCFNITTAAFPDIAQPGTKSPIRKRSRRDRVIRPKAGLRTRHEQKRVAQFFGDLACVTSWFSLVTQSARP